VALFILFPLPRSLCFASVRGVYVLLLPVLCELGERWMVNGA
jgi:hypothetical protein